MKQKDMLLIGVVALTSGIIAFALSTVLLAAPKNLSIQVEVVDPISSEFQTPDKRYFNEEALNPTQLIRIGENENQNPFQ